MAKPTVGLSMIAKDREATIGKALDSVAPYVDELLVVDTGSNDWTVEVAREHGSRVEFFAWCDDFAAGAQYRTGLRHDRLDVRARQRRH